jgi:hypothetical protein
MAGCNVCGCGCTEPVHKWDRHLLLYDSRWRHIKTGGVYRVVGLANMQAADSPLDGVRVVIYCGDQTWVRPVTEFLDGRFELVS